MELLSRNNISFNKKFGPVADALKDIGADVVLDGEIIEVNDDGKGNFHSISLSESGIVVKGAVRNIATIKSNEKEKVIFFLNNNAPVVYERK